ncbi:MAG: amidohydrolase family protein, partial [Actinomycetota bacterium]
MSDDSTRADTVDLLVRGAEVIATVDDERRELAAGWVACTDGRVVALGTDEPPPAERTLDATGCLVTPGLVNTHHHIYQNLTRAHGPALHGNLFDWLTTLYPIWAGLDAESVHLSTWIGLGELALGGCTTTMDHHYVHPRGGGDLIGAQVAAARELGVRFHATRGSMSLSEKDGGLPPDEVVQTDDEILADSERLVRTFHDPSPTAMVQVALAPCSP